MPTSNKLSKIDITENGKTPIYSSDTTNNGIIGYCDKKPNYIVDCHIPLYLVFGDHTRTMNIVEESFCIADNVKVLIPKIHSIKVLLYISTVWKKSIPNLGYARHWSKAKDVNIVLPTNKNKKIAINYIESYISELEEERISELEEERISELTAYLKVSGLDNYELSNNEKELLKQFKNSKIKFKQDKIKNYFTINSSKKKYNANTIKFGGNYPYVARGSNNNGIRGYITENIEYLNPEKTISFGQDTATIFYQEKPYFTGDKIKIMTYKLGTLTPEIANYFIATMRKSFSNFSWGQSSFNEKVLKETYINVPIKEDGTINYDFINSFIKIQEKLAIKDVVIWKDKIISNTKSIISE